MPRVTVYLSSDAVKLDVDDDNLAVLTGRVETGEAFSILGTDPDTGAPRALHVAASGLTAIGYPA